MGRPPKPIEIHRRNGNPSRKKLPDKSETISLVAASDVVPITLGPRGREVYRRSIDLATWLSELDRVALEDFAATWDEVCSMRERIATEGLTHNEPIVTPLGVVVGEKPIAHPLLKELRNAQKQLDTLRKVLGFDPTSHAQLGIAEVKRQSRVEELIARRQAK